MCIAHPRGFIELLTITWTITIPECWSRRLHKVTQLVHKVFPEQVLNSSIPFKTIFPSVRHPIRIRTGWNWILVLIIVSTLNNTCAGPDNGSNRAAVNNNNNSYERMQERNNELYRLINFKGGTSLDNITQWLRPLRFRRHGRTKSVTVSAGVSNRFRFKMAQYQNGLDHRFE